MNLELNLFDGEAADATATADVTAPAADAQPQTETDATDKNAEFEKLIKGEYKDQFEQRIKDNLKRRFKESSSLKEKIVQSDEIINLLKVKYGITNDNMADIASAIKNDDGLLKAEAMEQGIEPDTLKRIRELEFENETMKNQIVRGLEERKIRSAVGSWIKDANELKETYPEFDLEKEAQNKAFAGMLRAGVDLKSAYYAVHHEEIVKNMVENASREASLKVTDSIRARGVRPNENGMSGQSTAIIKTDVSKLTPGERADIARRVRAGEQISF